MTLLRAGSILAAGPRKGAEVVLRPQLRASDVLVSVWEELFLGQEVTSIDQRHSNTDLVTPLGLDTGGYAGCILLPVTPELAHSVTL